MSRWSVAIAAFLLYHGAVPTNAGEGHRVAFTTSVSRTPALHNWPERTEGFGVDAGDSICRNLAQAAGLSNPENFVAWLSDSNDDAYCRVHNLTGKKSANCGLIEVPVAAGPWVRTDGEPWAPTIDQLTVSDGAVVYTPLRYAADGTELPFEVERSWTGTGTGGTLAANAITCGDWQAEIVDVEARVGNHANTTGGWTANGYDNCFGGTNRLICLETEPGPPLDLPAEGARLAFVTNHFGSGDFSTWESAAKGTEGIEAADSICENRAIAAGIDDPGQFKAWISDAGTNAVDRFENDGPWYRPDGILVARSLADLTDGELFAPINIDEFGQYWPAQTVWTGSDSAGIKSANHCNSWQLEAADGNFGSANYASHFWAEANFPLPCTVSSRLYCLSDKPVETPRVAFVTPVANGPVMADWNEAAAAQTGLDAADSICRHFAQEGGLVNPQNFVAWMSDSNSDAYCRVHGFDGEKAANCGQGTLPAGAGPWVRTDGTPWSAGYAPGLGDVLRVYTPLDRDPSGEKLSSTVSVWTGTIIGTPQGDTACTDWTAASADLVAVGWTDRTTLSWSSQSLAMCDDSFPRHLYCLEKAPGPPLKLPPAPNRIAFVTSVGDDGVLGDWADAAEGTTGIEAGDSICVNRAQAAGLPVPESYRAWLSDGTAEAADRLIDYDGPWFRPDGFLIAESVADLTDGELLTSINQDEFGSYITSNSVWTGTETDGTPYGDDCDFWDQPESMARKGTANSVGGGWTSQFTGDCSGFSSRLYCFGTEYFGSFFNHGFENNDR